MFAQLWAMRMPPNPHAACSNCQGPSQHQFLHRFSVKIKFVTPIVVMEVSISSHPHITCNEHTDSIVRLSRLKVMIQQEHDLHNTRLSHATEKSKSIDSNDISRTKNYMLQEKVQEHQKICAHLHPALPFLSLVTAKCHRTLLLSEATKTYSNYSCKRCQKHIARVALLP